MYDTKEEIALIIEKEKTIFIRFFYSKIPCIDGDLDTKSWRWQCAFKMW